MPEINGKVIVITGAGSGMGEAYAMLLAGHGAKVVLGDIGDDRLEALAGRITEGGGDVTYATTDVRRPEDVSALTSLARDTYGKLDVLISNAGVMPISPLDDLRVTDWDLMVDVNIKGVLYGIAAALPVFRQQGFGHFVHMTSTAAFLTLPNQAVYSGTKAAVRAISEGLRKEGGETIRVTLVSPGYTGCVCDA